MTQYGGDSSPSSETEIQSSMDEWYGIRYGYYNLRPQREWSTNGWNALLVNPAMTQDEVTGQETKLTQYKVKQG